MAATRAAFLRRRIKQLRANECVKRSLPSRAIKQIESKPFDSPHDQEEGFLG